MLYIKLFIEREKNTGQSAPECPFKQEALLSQRPRDASCLSVVSFNIPTAQFFYY